jgi:hypothetical protein
MSDPRGKVRHVDARSLGRAVIRLELLAAGVPRVPDGELAALLERVRSTCGAQARLLIEGRPELLTAARERCIALVQELAAACSEPALPRHGKDVIGEVRQALRQVVTLIDEAA